jgi:hypothetical protein
MRNRGMTWRFMLCMMASGLITCLLVLCVLYVQRGYLKRSEIIGATGALVFSCLLLVLAGRSFRKDTPNVNSPDKEREEWIGSNPP